MRKVRSFKAALELLEVEYPFPKYPVGLGRVYLRAQEEGGEPTPLRGIRWVVRKSPEGLEMIRVVSETYALIPNELVEAKALKIAKSYKLEFLKSELNQRGTGIRIDFLSQRVKEEVQKGDLVRFGVSVRNSIDGSSSLAVDLLSYRLICLNGATAEHADISRRLWHTGNPKVLLELFEEALHEALKGAEEKSGELFALYRKMARTPLSPEAAYMLANLNFPAKCYADMLKIHKSEEDPKQIQRVEILPQAQRYSLWDAFNHITAILSPRPNERDRKKSQASALARSQMTRRLHKVMERLIEG